MIFIYFVPIFFWVCVFNLPFVFPVTFLLPLSFSFSIFVWSLVSSCSFCIFERGESFVDQQCVWVQAGGQSSVLGKPLLPWLFPAVQLMAEMFPLTLPAVLWWQVGPGEASAAVLCRSVVFQARACALLLFGVLSSSEIWSLWHSLLMASLPCRVLLPLATCCRAFSLTGLSVMLPKIGVPCL